MSEILAALVEQEKERSRARQAEGKWHVTDLLGCLRESFIKKYCKEGVDYIVETSALWARLRGTLSHRILADLPAPRWQVETPVSIEVAGVKIVGSIDAIDTERRFLCDLKTTNDFTISKGALKYPVSSDYVTQLNIYRYMYESLLNDIDRIQGLELHYMSSTPMFAVPVEMYSRESVNTFLAKQVKRIEDAGRLGIKTLWKEGAPLYGGKKCTQYCDVKTLCDSFPCVLQEQDVIPF